MFNLFKKKEFEKAAPKVPILTAAEAKSATELSLFHNTVATLKEIDETIDRAVKKGYCYVELYRKTPTTFYCPYSRYVIDVDYLDSVLTERGFEIRLVEKGEFGGHGLHYLIWGDVEL